VRTEGEKASVVARLAAKRSAVAVDRILPNRTLSQTFVNFHSSTFMQFSSTFELLCEGQECSAEGARWMPLKGSRPHRARKRLLKTCHSAQDKFVHGIREAFAGL